MLTQLQATKSFLCHCFAAWVVISKIFDVINSILSQALDTPFDFTFFSRALLSFDHHETVWIGISLFYFTEINGGNTADN